MLTLINTDVTNGLHPKVIYTPNFIRIGRWDNVQNQWKGFGEGAVSKRNINVENEIPKESTYQISSTMGKGSKHGRNFGMERRHPRRSIFGDLKSAIKISIIDILPRRFFQHVRVCLL